jgi:predicted Holliday junction resolvase-like endonuclease
MDIVAIILSAAMTVGLVMLYKYNRSLNKELGSLRTEKTVLTTNLEWANSELNSTQHKLTAEQEKSRKVVSQKKSSETRLGQITEHMIPVMEKFPYDKKNLHFLGNPIDYLHFDFDEGSITFIEVKSGNSRVSKRQKIVKNIIKTGRVYYDEVRLNEKGLKVKGRTND